MKVAQDNLPSVLQKPDKKPLEQKHLKPQMIALRKCFSCSKEQQFPIHCTQRMDYEDGQLVCEICKEKMPLPNCSKCNQPLGIAIKKMEHKD
ncbi:MAG: hypothetical protein ACTSSK_02350 [Candidatus Heimdallarchaeota archaeon]